MCQVRYSHTNRVCKEAAKENLKKAFFTGGNSSCCAHIRQHYEIYKAQCKDGDIPENHHAIPSQYIPTNEHGQENKRRDPGNSGQNACEDSRGENIFA
jgi:hypothetical protein